MSVGCVWGMMLCVDRLSVGDDDVCRSAEFGDIDVCRSVEFGG